MRIVSRVTSNQLLAKGCSNIIVLLCNAETERVEGLMSKRQDIKKKCSENFIECFAQSKNGMAKYMSTKKNFLTILKSKIF